MKLKHIAKLSTVAAALFLSFSANAKDGRIKVGVMSGAEEGIAEVAQQVAKDKYNLDVELIPFTDYVIPNEALYNGDLDVNAFQHKPYLDAQKKARGYKGLVVVGNTFVFPIGAYSNTVKSIKDLPKGATIVVPNDPTNLGRALVLLQKHGLIKLADPNSITQTDLDIVENPKDFNIKPVDAAMTALTLNDGVALAVINGNYAVEHGLEPKEALIIEDKDSPYVNLIVAREDNQNDPDVKHFVEAFQTDVVFKKAQEAFKGGIVKGW